MRHTRENLMLDVALVLFLLAAHAAWGDGLTRVYDEGGNLTGTHGQEYGGGGGGGGAIYVPQPQCYNPAPQYGSSTLIIIGGDRRQRPIFDNRRPNWGGRQQQYRRPQQQWGYGNNQFQYAQPQFYGGGYGNYGGNLGALQAQNEALQRQLDSQQRWNDATRRNTELRQQLGY